MVEKEEVKEIKEDWVVQEIPTATEPMAVNIKEKTAYTQIGLLVKIANNIEDIKKALQ